MDLSEYSDRQRIDIYEMMINSYNRDTDSDNSFWINPLQYKIDAIKNKKYIRIKNVRYKIQEDISEQTFNKYIKTNWSKREIAKLKDRCCNQFDAMGKSIGIYHKNELVGFTFYDFNIKERDWSGWFKLIADQFVTYPIKYYAANLEIDKTYRRNGLGSILLIELYNKMPHNSILFAESEHTDNHIKFYTYNGFIFNKNNDVQYITDWENHYTMYKCKS